MYFAASAVQRIGQLNTAFRVLTSIPCHAETPQVGQGELLFAEVSWTPPHSHDVMYVNVYWGIDDYSSAARGPDTGGPLGRTGILYSAVGLGRYGAALGNRPRNSAGASLGWQMFFDETRKQLILEIGGQDGTNGQDNAAIAFAARYQQAIGQNMIFRLDGFVAGRENALPSRGVRMEVVVKF